MNFLNALENATNLTETENGATAFKSTTSHVLDLYGTIGALRTAPIETKIRLFEKAVNENKFLTAKLLFHCRDIREGMGEIKTFQELLKYAADNYPEIVIPNIALIGEYGKFEDLYCLIGTKCEHYMWKFMKRQFELDLENMKSGKPCSLLAKWIKTPDASSPTTRALGILTSQKLGYPNVAAFKKDLKPLRKYLKIVEIDVSAEHFDTIAYDKVPSKAMLKYKDLFMLKDNIRYNLYLEEVKAGTKKINAGCLYPYDIVRKVLYGQYDETMELQWQALPNYVNDDTNVLIMADVSGSMTCDNMRPMASSIGLAIYFAQRTRGVFHNKFMTFSKHTSLETLLGKDLKSEIEFLETRDWGMNTNLDLAMQTILDAALTARAKQEEIPKALVIISDMQIDMAVSDDKTFYQRWKKKFEDTGYSIPNVVFWNVNAEIPVFHADTNVEGVQYLSGHSVSSFNLLLSCIDSTPTEAMLSVLMSERYAPVTVA